jgi:hypothetical protein
MKNNLTTDLKLWESVATRSVIYWSWFLRLSLENKQISWDNQMELHHLGAWPCML